MLILMDMSDILQKDCVFGYNSVLIQNKRGQVCDFYLFVMKGPLVSNKMHDLSCGIIQMQGGASSVNWHPTQQNPL